LRQLCEGGSPITRPRLRSRVDAPHSGAWNSAQLFDCIAV
jgi:hypothetical protein